MKKGPVFISMLACLFFLSSSNSSDAQLFKKVLNTVKTTAENRTNDKAAQTTNQVFDKVDNATTTKAKSNANTTTTAQAQGDTVPTNKVFGAFAKAAQENPNDTSAADLTMKALGNLVGGGGVSAADSAAAIKSFMKSSSGSGFYYETTNTVVTKRGTVKTINKSYFTPSGEGRVEMNLAAMMGVSGARPMVGLSRADKRGYSIILDDEDRTYSLNIIDTSLLNVGHIKYTATRIGNETVGGYPCVHARLRSSGSSNSDMDIWTCKTVPGYSLLEKMMAQSKSVATPDMMQALKQAGADGYFVRITIKNKDISSDMLLTKVEQKNLPASLFTIPAGYTESKNNGIISNLMKAGQNQK